MKIDVEKSNAEAMTNLLNEARREADSLRRRLRRYENILLSSRLVMGHEIKKPTTAITGYLDLAIEMLEGKARRKSKSTAAAIDNLKKARRECELLRELNQVFLALLKIDGEEEVLPSARIEVGKLFAEVIDGLPAKYGARDRVEVHVSPRMEEIFFSPDALRLIVANLVENALIYSSEGSKVLVEVERVQDKRKLRDRELMRIQVTDRGVGIPKEYLEKIFSPFVRLHSDRTEGTGLGLTLVRSLVELHQGEISVTSEKGTGTTVYVMVPIVENDSDRIIL
jgi:signal transduction histidine kinase